ncbi:MAG: hypothetical protein ACLKAN_08345 [Alkaliphilus sp.]
MNACKRYISLLLATSMIVMLALSGLFPFKGIARAAYATPDSSSTMTNSSTVVGLDELRSKVVDETDTDNDGLSDQVEKIIGTNPNESDSDGDGLNDLFELENNLDPLKEDTNGDGLLDLHEITRGDTNTQLTSEMVLRDTDSDGTIDVFDDDNDNDGIKDFLDISPFSKIDAAESQKIKAITSGKATYVEIQIQPADLENLYKNDQIMTWPVDNYGQVRNFDGSEGDLTVTPMLEVVMQDYPNEQIMREHGYVFTGNSMLVPLQEIEQEGSKVGLIATIYMPANTGVPIGSGKFEVEMDLKLKWSLIAGNDNINKEWDTTALVKYNGKPVKITDIDADDRAEYIGSSIGHLNNNDIPDLAIFWLNSFSSKWDGRLISNVHQKIYYDLVYNDNKNIFEAGSVKPKDVLYGASNGMLGYVNEDDNERILNSRFSLSYDAFTWDGSKVLPNFIYYTGDTELNTKVRFGAYRTSIIKNRGNSEAGNTTVDNHAFFELKNRRDDIVAEISNLRDKAYKYDSTSDTVWFLYEIYNNNTEKNELIMKRNYKHGSSYRTHEKVLFSDLPADAKAESERNTFRDLARALSIDVYDVNGDEKQDLMFTDRLGRMHIISDCNSSGWENRVHNIPLKLGTDKVHGQHTQFFDFNNDTSNDMVSVQAFRSRNSEKTDLTFRVAVKEGISKGSAFITKDYEAFKITGIQVEEKNEIKTAIVHAESTEKLLNMASVFQHLFMNSSESISQEISQYRDSVMEDPNDISVIEGEYEHFYSAMLDIGRQLYEDIGSVYQGIKPVLLLFYEESKYLNLDDFEDVYFTGNGVRLDVSARDIVSKKQMTMQWISGTHTLGQREINEMVDNNPNGVFDFNENKFEVKEQLAFWNLGVANIVGIGTTFPERVNDFIRVASYDWARYPDSAFGATTRVLGIKVPIQTIGNVGGNTKLNLQDIMHIPKLLKELQDWAELLVLLWVFTREFYMEEKWQKSAELLLA